MDLIEWIDLIGKKKVAELLGVTRENIYQWINGQTSPKVMTAHKIVSLSCGVVDWEGIYRPYVQARLQESDKNQLKLKL